MAEVDVKSVLERVATIAGSQINHMVKRFEMELPADLPKLYTDSNAIEQIVLNMLINACQAADKTESWVRLMAYMPLDRPDSLCIEIADNGCGMDDKTIGHIFDPLFTIKGPASGTGLGLFICHNLVEGLGGTIDVQSVPGESSTFQVILPILGPPPSGVAASMELNNPS